MNVETDCAFQLRRVPLQSLPAVWAYGNPPEPPELSAVNAYRLEHPGSRLCVQRAKLTIVAVGWRRIAAGVMVAGLFFSVAANPIACFEQCESIGHGHSAVHHHSAIPMTVHGHRHVHSQSPTEPCDTMSSITTCCLGQTFIASLVASTVTKRFTTSAVRPVSAALTYPPDLAPPAIGEHRKPPLLLFANSAVMPLRI